ncbi:hypothetical protein T440DRAFT_24621 [Plenodomus tracheiphilus IPT5]|uniref:F-box domain-containing protein n=1 Tax=Plenodomus tracheiphilus IPT5 TaxID=1408161 RepID=A0A6A7BCI5_9PLEO|nr:hypothetical protein T440DRAFT_24621 [Plenodomus tracheiphilus IPT5]
MLLPKRLRSDASERHYDDLCAPPHPYTTDDLRKPTRTKERTVSLPQTLARRLSRSKTRLPPSRPSETLFKYNLEIPYLQPTPWELHRHERHSAVPRRRADPPKRFPARVFQDLPREIYDCILAQTKELHLDCDRACTSCYLNDMCSLSLVSRIWDRAATAKLYQTIVLPTDHHQNHMSNSESRILTRLRLLRRTLRDHPTLARYVRELHFADIYPLYEQAGIEKEGIVNLVASLVMASPHLERLVGFHVPLRHSFDRLSHALSTRRHLKEKIWFLDCEENSSCEEEDEEEGGPYYHASHDPPERFLLLNSNHNALSTLVLHQEPGQPSPYLNFRSIIGSCRMHPNLRHLALCGLAGPAFTNLTLNALPLRLESLRLENLTGINDKGLQRFLNSPQASDLASLTLIDLAIKSIQTLSTILSPTLSKLTSFTIAQAAAPSQSPKKIPIPPFYSPTLHTLHWEFKSEAEPLPILPNLSPTTPTPTLTKIPSSSSPPPPPQQQQQHQHQPPFPFKTPSPLPSLATTLLATSILTTAFPNLHTIHIPHDPQHLIQNLCKQPATAVPASVEVAGADTGCRMQSPSTNSFAMEKGKTGIGVNFTPNHAFTATVPTQYTTTTTIPHPHRAQTQTPIHHHTHPCFQPQGRDCA